MKHALTAAVALALAAALPACQSKHEQGVTSNYRSQWTNVAANVQQTTRAAETVLKENAFDDVRSNATAVDGTATAKKSDGTKVNVAIRKEKETTSQVSVTVGTLGDPALGAELARKIKTRAEGGTASSTTTR
jgi:hypothetical protein